MVHRVAIIGAGVSGLVAIKECLEEGLEPVCFEQYDHIGGAWYYSDDLRPNQGAHCFYHTQTNISKELLAFSDFPFSDDYPEFMHHSLYLKYLDSYADNYDLKRYIRFNSLVIQVRPATDFNSTGKLIVKVKNSENSAKTETDESNPEDAADEHVFDAMFVCSGPLRIPTIPDVKGQQDFKGKIMHTHSYFKPDIFVNKRILIIGNQNSAGAVALEASLIASQVYLSVGSGTWLGDKVAPGGVPKDTRKPRFLNNLYSIQTLGDFERDQRNKNINHTKYKLQKIKEPLSEEEKSKAGKQKDGRKPNNPYTDGHIMDADGLAYHIISGKVKVLGQILEITGKGAVFDDNEHVDDIDIIVFATGYGPDYKFVEFRDVQGKNPKFFNLYKWTFPIGMRQHTLAVIHALKLDGPVTPSVELQVRWALRIFQGKSQLPPIKKMQSYLDKQKKFFKTICNGRTRIWSFKYCEELAKEIGVGLSFYRILRKDRLLAFRTYFGPALPPHYRLLGPGAKSDAWTLSHQAYERVVCEMGMDWPRSLVKAILVGTIILVLMFRISYTCLM